jgi:semaphorin 6
VDNAAGPHGNYTVLFIGSEAGVVLKVLAKTSPLSLNDSILLEEIDLFNRAKYGTLTTRLSLSLSLTLFASLS